jgi:hypothetical protein
VKEDDRYKHNEMQILIIALNVNNEYSEREKLSDGIFLKARSTY